MPRHLANYARATCGFQQGPDMTLWTYDEALSQWVAPTQTKLVKHVFPLADWLWEPIVASPVLHSNSTLWAGYLSAAGKIHPCGMRDFGVAIIQAKDVDVTTPRYDVGFDNVPEWGADPFGSDTIPIPVDTVIPLMHEVENSDSQFVVVDPVSGKVYGAWQAVQDAGPPITWSASWGGVTTIDGDGIDTAGSTTATGLSRYAGVIRADEIASAAAKNIGLPHALFCASDICSPAFVPPAIKSDGDNAGAVATPIPEGTRLQLDPTINVDSIVGITKGEKVIAKTLQTHGAYIGDKGGSRLSFGFEYQRDSTPSNPGSAYVALGLEWDYFDMSHIPWSSLRVLKKWNGVA